MSRLTCERDHTSGSDVQVVLIGTVIGREVASGSLVRMLNKIEGYHMRGLPASVGWLHLSAFAQRWLELREKGENTLNPAFPYFSQFRSTPRDGFFYKHGSDFRPLAELLRHRIKPAWMHFFNMSQVMCGVRMLMLSMLGVSPEGSAQNAVVGVSHAFDTVEGYEQYSNMYDAEDAIGSLDLFLKLFPRGRVFVHLPAWPLPESPAPPARCICLGSSLSPCTRSPGLDFPLWNADGRRVLVRKLADFAQREPNRSFLTAPQQFQNRSHLAELLFFLNTSTTERLLDAMQAADRSARSRLLRLVNHTSVSHIESLVEDSAAASFPWSPVQACRANLHGLRRNESRRVVDADFWCTQKQCRAGAVRMHAAAKHRFHCTRCALGLAEWAWHAHMRSDSDTHAVREQRDLLSGTL